MSDDGTLLTFTVVPIRGLLGCCVPVQPGCTDGATDGFPGERTELCAVDAFWLLGRMPVCDVHVRQLCDGLGIDWPELLEEAGRDLDEAGRPWAERERHDQARAREAFEHFMA